jgi:hypothetical protein
MNGWPAPAVFTKSDRGLFCSTSFPTAAGLLFSVTRLGVRPTVAWHWMWLLPTGYNFLLRPAARAMTVYALAAVDFGLRAWTSRPVQTWHALLAAALLTGAKASNLPLLLPWAF